MGTTRPFPLIAHRSARTHSDARLSVLLHGRPGPPAERSPPLRAICPGLRSASRCSAAPASRSVLFVSQHSRWVETGHGRLSCRRSAVPAPKLEQLIRIFRGSKDERGYQLCAIRSCTGSVCHRDQQVQPLTDRRGNRAPEGGRRAGYEALCGINVQRSSFARIMYNARTCNVRAKTLERGAVICNRWDTG